MTLLVTCLSVLWKMSHTSLYFDCHVCLFTWTLFFSSFFFKMWLWLSCASPYYYFLRNVSLRWLSCASLCFDTHVFYMWLLLSCACLYFERRLTRLSTLIVKYVSLLWRFFFFHVPLIVMRLSVLWEMSHTSFYFDCQVRLFTLTFFFLMWLYLSYASLYFERCLTHVSVLTVMCVSIL